MSYLNRLTHSDISDVLLFSFNVVNLEHVYSGRTRKIVDDHCLRYICMLDRYFLLIDICRMYNERNTTIFEFE